MSLGEYISAESGITKGLYHFNGNGNDSSGNGKNLSGTGITYSLANGKFGQGAGMTTGNLSLANNLGIDGGSVTISIWVKKTNTIGLNKYGGIIDQNSNISKTGYTIGFSNDAGVMNIYINRCRLGVADQTIGYAYTISSTKFDNICLTYNSATTILTLYLNGSYINSRTASGNGTSNINGFEIGDYYGGGSTAKFNSNVDEVIIDNVEWSAEKYKKYYSMCKGRFGIL
ncbi:MAG: hypothetical protein NTZ33_14545 [Bacteroidetes bacterium]|nr:hypothetical protein [Bacteroidota bacterium]